MIGSFLLLLQVSLGAPEPAAFRHAMVQLDRLLEDRPAMAAGMIDEDPLRAWALAAFAETAGQRVYWDPTPPPSGVEAQHAWTDRLLVRVAATHQSGPRRGKAKGFSDAWADLVFEIHNAGQLPHYRAAWDQARQHRIDRWTWLERLTRGEHRALLYTQAFHRTRWRLWMRQRGAAPISYRWSLMLQVPIQYRAWINRYRDPNGYPYRDYLGAWTQAFGEGPDPATDPFALRNGPLPRLD